MYPKTKAGFLAAYRGRLLDTHPSVYGPGVKGAGERLERMLAKCRETIDGSRASIHLGPAAHSAWADIDVLHPPRLTLKALRALPEGDA